jgi:flagellar motor switch protein FliN
MSAVEQQVDANPPEQQSGVVVPLQAGDKSAPDAARKLDEDLALVLDVPVQVAVEIGRTTMTIGEILAVTPGTVVTLNRLAGEPVDLLVNGRLIGLRVTDVVSPESRIHASAGK